jgi:hypothetical protein
VVLTQRSVGTSSEEFNPTCLDAWNLKKMPTQYLLLPALRLAALYGLASVLLAAIMTSTGCVHGPGYYGPPSHRPHAHVYFQFTTGVYFYLDGGVWIKTRVLPPHIHIDAGNRVRIRVESDKPYLRHNEHVRVYKSEPNYRVDVERSRKEREANQRWYQEYQKQTPKGRKKKERY